MANYNMSGIKKIVAKLGLQCQLIPSEANPLNCKYIMIQGKQLKSSQWSKTEAEAILSGYTNNPCTTHELDALDEFFKNNTSETGNKKELIHFQNQSLTSCFEKFRELTENNVIYSVGAWIETMTDFFTNETSGKADTTTCANKIKSMIQNREVYILNGFVYSTHELTSIIKLWQKENNIKNSINYGMVINNYINAVKKIL